MREIDAAGTSRRLTGAPPFVGKRWVHMVASYDRELGISYWTKNYRTSIESAEDVDGRQYAYYDPIDTLPPSGQQWWRSASVAPPQAATVGA